MRGVFLAFISLFCGMTAAAIAAGWMLLVHASGYDMPIGGDLADVEGLMAARMAFTAFIFVLPLTALAAIVTGIAGFQQMPGKIGLVCAVFALMVFAIYLPGATGAP